MLGVMILGMIQEITVVLSLIRRSPCLIYGDIWGDAWSDHDGVTVMGRAGISTSGRCPMLPEVY